MWLTGEKTEPRFTYGLVSEEPLVLSDDVGYVEDGEEKHILGQDTWRGDEFVWRGRKVLKLVASHWSVAGMSDDGSIAIIRFSKSLLTPSGVDIIVREGAEHPELRRTIAHGTEEFGITPEEFGSLTWFTAAPTNG